MTSASRRFPSENIRFTRQLLEERKFPTRSIVVAVKPFMQRRALATLAVYWPEMPATVASPAMTLDEYFTDELKPETIINIMMGDLQRLWVYARRGWSAPQPLPVEVAEAFDALVQLGFTKHLMAGEPIESMART